MECLMQRPECIVLDEASFGALLSRLDACNLPSSDITLLKDIMHFSLWLQKELESARMTIKKLCNIFNITKSKTESRSSLKKDAENIEQESEIPNLKELKANLKKAESSFPLKGHGRNGADAYQDIKEIEIKHKTLSAGSLCPFSCGGRVYSIPAGSVIRITGQAMAVATRYVLEKLRCGLCGSVFTASLPLEAGEEKYDVQIKSLLGIYKYYIGMPFYRLENMQKMLGVPLSDATQWELVETVGGTVLPIYHVCERKAANAETMYHDDTVARILSLMKENRTTELKRKGIFITGIVSKVGEHRIYLFYAGRNHAGENVKKLLQKRDHKLERFIQMCDALHLTFTEEFISILCHCLSHARRRFYEIYDYYPQSCWFVINQLAKIYRYDRDCREQGMNEVERLNYHTENSGPLMMELKEWLDKQIEQKLVEPNSRLGKAIKYFRKHWDKLTRFLHVPGAPLDNNIVEQALKIPIRLRKNALFYKTVYGAYIGSVMMSILHTCVMAKQNPLHYLNALQRNKTEVMRNPESWLPWCYQQTMEQKAA
jgi:transposase